MLRAESPRLGHPWVDPLAWRFSCRRSAPFPPRPRPPPPRSSSSPFPGSRPRQSQAASVCAAGRGPGASGGPRAGRADVGQRQPVILPPAAAALGRGGNSWYPTRLTAGASRAGKVSVPGSGSCCAHGVLIDPRNEAHARRADSYIFFIHPSFVDEKAE